MIDGRGKWLYRVIGLAAYNAARHFAARHLNAFGRSQTWRPMVLRWRLRRKPLGNALACRATRHSQVSWFPQFHFHFASHMSDQTRPKPMQGHAPAADSGRTRVVMDHRWTSVLTATPGLQLDKAKHAAPEMYERKGRSAQRRGPVPPAPRISWPHLPNQLVTWTTQPERRQLFQPRPEVRASMQRGIQTQFLHTRSQIWQHWQHLSSRRQPTFREPVGHSSGGTMAFQLQYEHSEKLVWRRTLQTPLSNDDDQRGTELSESVSRTQSRPQPGQESAAGVALLPEPAAATRVTKLEPGVLDRLTDHVIRRVEQRMRIERQRRGL